MFNEISFQEFLNRLASESAPETNDDGFRDHRAHLVELVIDNMGEEFMTTVEVVQAADVLFQYIMTRKVPE